MRALVLFFALCASALAGEPPALRGFAVPLDGGSFRLYAVSADGSEILESHVRVRLWGIEAPPYRRLCGRERWACGRESAFQLLEILSTPPGELVSCQEMGAGVPAASEEAVSARCVLADGEADVAELMVRRGMALAREERYFAAQNLAKREGLGIWRR